MKITKFLAAVAGCTALGSVMLVGCAPPAESTTTDTTTTTGGEAPTTGNRPMPTAQGNSASGDTIKIGIVAAQGGDLRPWGVDSIDGAMLAVEEVNAAGGINGKKVELLVGDSNSRPEQGKNATEKLISDGVVGIIGEVASGITQQMVQATFQAGIPHVTIGSTRTDLTPTAGNLWRVCYTDDFQGPVMARFAYEELGLRNMGVMTDKSQPYSTGLSENFKRAFEALGGKIVGEEFYMTGQSSFQGQLTNLAQRRPDGVFLSGYFTEVGIIARQATAAGLNVPLLGGDGWDSAELVTTGGENIIGNYFCNHYNNEEDRSEVQRFLDAWRAKYGGVPATTMGALGYDAAMLMMDALKRASEPNSQALMVAIEETVDFPGVSGNITLAGKNGDPQKRALVVEVTRDGQRFVKAYEFFTLDEITNQP
jgi:branched-chain amino acid transport system substrate-binding protein